MRILFYSLLKMRGKRVSSEFARAVYKVHDSRILNKQIAKQLKSHPRTIKKIIEGRVPGTCEQSKVNLIHPRASNKRQDDRLIVALKRNRFQGILETAAAVGYSRQTATRRARERGMRVRVARINFLKRQQRLARWRWCLESGYMDWSCWIFSDEVAFELAD